MSSIIEYKIIINTTNGNMKKKKYISQRSLVIWELFCLRTLLAKSLKRIKKMQQINKKLFSEFKLISYHCLYNDSPLFFNFLHFSSAHVLNSEARKPSRNFR